MLHDKLGSVKIHQFMVQHYNFALQHWRDFLTLRITIKTNVSSRVSSASFVCTWNMSYYYNCTLDAACVYACVCVYTCIEKEQGLVMTKGCTHNLHYPLCWDILPETLFQWRVAWKRRQKFVSLLRLVRLPRMRENSDIFGYV